jgi:cell division protease FtsH
LENLVNEAAIMAARKNKKTIGRDDLAEAIDRVISGPQRKSRLISDREKLMTAYHEAGHALVARMLANADPVHKVSIIARGMMGGYTRVLPEEDRSFWTKAQFEDTIAYAMGGRVAEELIFMELSTGASNDIERATGLARRMVTEYGMSEKLGPLALGKKDELVFLGREISEQRNYSDEIAFEIDKEIRWLIDRAYARATEIVTANRDKLEQIAMLLMERETIEGAEIEELFDTPRPRPQLSGPMRYVKPDSTPEESQPSSEPPAQAQPQIRPSPATG